MPTTTPTSMNSVLFSCASDNWPTPQPFYDRLNAEFQFGLDACADRANAKTDAYYGFDHEDPARRNALACNWVADADGRAVWVNPPYGRFGIKQFMAKAVQAARNGTTVVCLVPARTCTKWWHNTVHQSGVAVDVRFVKGRLRFGTATASAPFPSAVLVLGPGATGSLTAMASQLPNGVPNGVPAAAPNRIPRSMAALGCTPLPAGQMELFADLEEVA